VLARRRKHGAPRRRPGAAPRLVTRRPDGNLHQAPPWRTPEADREGGWHLTGSILGADLALASESLRRVSIDRFPSPPTLSDAEEQTIAESIALIVPFDQSDADRDALVSALALGRRKLEETIQRPTLWAGAADAMRIRDFRRELLSWTIAHEPAALLLLVSLGELVQLGQIKGAPARFAAGVGDLRPGV